MSRVTRTTWNWIYTPRIQLASRGRLVTFLDSRVMRKASTKTNGNLNLMGGGDVPEGRMTGVQRNQESHVEKGEEIRTLTI